jgi:hypothetical protein
MSRMTTHSACREANGAGSLASAAAVDVHRFAGAHQAAKRLKIHGITAAPFMGAVGRVHAARESKVLFFQRKLDEGRIPEEALAGLRRDYPELRFPVTK